MADIKRIPLLIVFLVTLFPSLYADDCFHVVDEGNQEVKGAVVTACDTISNKIIEVSVTDESGKACLVNNIKPTDCIIVSAPGYARYTSSYQDCARTIKISHDATELNEVTVYADKDQLSQKGGALVFTPGSLKTEVSNIFDLVKYVPLINYQNGAFAIVGKSGYPIIKINGEDARELGAGLFQALQALPATMVKQVEVSPSSGSAESASFNGGIINIVIDMPDEGVLNRANASIGYRRDFSTEESYLLWWKHDRFNGSANLRFSNYADNNSVEYRYGYPDIGKYVTQTDRSKSNMQNVNGSVNMMYRTSRTGIVGMGIGLSSGHQWESSNTSGTTEINGESRNTEFSRQSYKPWNVPSYGISLWYTQTPNKKNIFDIYAGYSHNARDSYNLYSDYETPSQASETRQDLSLKAQGYAAQLRYLRTVSDSHDISAGYSLSGIDVRQRQTFTAEIPDDFRYRDMTNALFVEWNAQWSKNLSTKIGVRGEYLHMYGKQTAISTDFSRNYWGLYPSVAISYNIPKGEQSLSFTADRKIDPPLYVIMNPYKRWDSESSYYVGNPDLRPSYIWELGLIYSFLSNWVVSLSWEHLPGLAVNYTYRKGGYTVTSHTNANKCDYFSINAEYSKSFWQRLRVNVSAKLTHSSQRGVIEGVYLSDEKTYVHCDLKLNYLISKRYQWRASARAYYWTPDGSLTNNGRTSYNLSVEVSKDWACGLSLKAACDRIIRNNDPLIYSSADYESYHRVVYNPVKLSLSLAYVFGNMRVSRVTERPMLIK